MDREGSPTRHGVALFGFGAFERSAIATCLRLTSERRPAYECKSPLEGSDFLLVDAGHAPSVASVLKAGAESRTVFIGGVPPPGATSWLPRPIDPSHVLRELDMLVAQRVRVGVSVPVVPGRAKAPGAEALIVDDSEIAQHFLRHRLARRGLAADCASTSGKAIELLACRAYPFVFIDVELGDGSELDGLALCQHLKRQHRHAGGARPPVVALVSAHHGPVDRARGALAGCDAYLGKPLDEPSLQALLHRHRDAF